MVGAATGLAVDGPRRSYGSVSRASLARTTSRGYVGSMGYTLTLRDFRAFTRATFAQQGVCALVGPNGSGKSTLVRAFEAFRRAVRTTPAQGLDAAFEPGPWRRVGAPADGPVELALATPAATWTLGLDGHPDCRERAQAADQEGFATRRASTGWTWHPGWLPGPVPCDQAPTARLRVEAAATRIVTRYDVDLRPPRLLGGWDDAHAPDARGARWLVQHWRLAAPDRAAFVEATLAAAFPTLDLAAPHADCAGVRSLRASLTALAAADRGGLVLLDEPERALHPHAVQALVAAARDRRADLGHDLAVVFVTASATLVNCFRHAAAGWDEVYAIDSRAGGALTPVADHADADRLARGALGDRFERSEFGGHRDDR